jgi:hypothetical protein
MESHIEDLGMRRKQQNVAPLKSGIFVKGISLF